VEDKMVERNPEYATPSDKTTRGEENLPEHGENLSVDMPIEGPHFENKEYFDEKLDEIAESVEEGEDMSGPATYIGRFRYESKQEAAEEVGVRVPVLEQFLQDLQNSAEKEFLVDDEEVRSDGGGNYDSEKTYGLLTGK
jgi:hypothetical protein